MGKSVDKVLKKPSGKKDPLAPKKTESQLPRPRVSPKDQATLFQKTVGNRAFQRMVKTGAVQAKPGARTKLTKRGVALRYKALLRALRITKSLKIRLSNYRYDWRDIWRMHWDKIPFSVENRPHCNRLADMMVKVYRAYEKAESALKSLRTTRKNPTADEIEKEKFLRQYGYRFVWVKDGKVTIYGPDRLLYKNVTYREYQDAMKYILWIVKTSGLGKYKTPVAKPPWTASEIIEEGKKRFKERKNIWNLGKRIGAHPLYIPYIVALGNSMAKEWNTRWAGTQINPIHSKAKAVVDQCIQQKRAPFDCVETAFNKAVYPANASDFAKVARLADKEVSPAKQLQILRSIINVNRGIFEPYPIKKLK